MPRTSKSLTQKEREKWFVNLFLDKYGADEAKVPLAEKRASLKPGAGQRILKRKAVQAEIHKRLEPVRFEQFRQQVLTEAAVVAKAGMQEELKAKVDGIRRLKIEVDVLDHELMSGVIGLDWQMFPKEKLEVIKAAYIVNGTMESGNTRRIAGFADKPDAGPTTGIYTSLFQRLALPSPPEPALEPPKADDGVFDLVPRPQSKTPIPSGGPLPPAGESIDETPTTPKSNSRVITVEVG